MKYYFIYYVFIFIPCIAFCQAPCLLFNVEVLRKIPSSVLVPFDHTCLSMDRGRVDEIQNLIYKISFYNCGASSVKLVAEPTLFNDYSDYGNLQIRLGPIYIRLYKKMGERYVDMHYSNLNTFDQGHSYLSLPVPPETITLKPQKEYVFSKKSNYFQWYLDTKLFEPGEYKMSFDYVFYYNKEVYYDEVYLGDAKKITDKMKKSGTRLARGGQYIQTSANDTYFTIK